MNKPTPEQIQTALEDLFRAAEQMVYRPPVDDSRLIDRHTRDLRETLEHVRPVVSPNDPRFAYTPAVRNMTPGNC